ncbi:glycosyl hydrolase family 38 protein [Artemisia annua]|uniref:Glycosyl hydrolase family 38 protein n=1 Tax=Artemisia annua TaxID=35608 RepID=A0A2U1PML3_ARTAN|nr:glycosyl hydrolase family 38 protein [Artemisia annua]
MVNRIRFNEREGSVIIFDTPQYVVNEGLPVAFKSEEDVVIANLDVDNHKDLTGKSYCPLIEFDLLCGKTLVSETLNMFIVSPFKGKLKPVSCGLQVLLGWNISDVIKLLVVSKNIGVYDSRRKQVESQLLPIVKDSISLRDDNTTAYTASNLVKQTLHKHMRIGKGGVVVGTGNLKLICFRSEGKLSQYVNG